MKEEYMERLTLEAIRIDVKASIKWSRHIAMLLISCVWAYFAISSIIHMAEIGIPLIVFFSTLFTICFGLWIWCLLLDIKKLRNLKNGNISIKKDTLSDTKVFGALFSCRRHKSTMDPIWGGMGRRMLDAVGDLSLVRIYYTVLYFSTCFSRGKYKIMPAITLRNGKTYYKWSEKHSMDVNSITNSCEYGDEFYLVFLGSKDPAVVYNTKFFYIEGE